MVIASGSPGDATSSKLRRSRRLSSTRGLKVGPNANTGNQAIPRQDLNQKLGLCPIVSRNVVDAKTGAPINWELNERISLSSGSSAGLEVRPDVRKGIELSGNRKKPEIDARQAMVDKQDRRENIRGVKSSLELMNVSGFQQDQNQRRKDSWSIDVDVIERPEEEEEEEENVIKSDSKYEIGIPSDGTTGSRKSTKQRRQLSTGAKSQKSAKNEEEDGANGKWGRKKVDKTNDSISKRLELIHELNQKILANYERFQQRSRSKNHSKETKETLSKASSKEQSGRTRLALNEPKEPRKEDHVYTETRRKGRAKTECVVQRSSQDSLRQRKLDINKFTFSKEHCEKLAASKDHRVDTLDKKRSTKTLSKSRILRDNENFIMAPRPGFCEPGEDKDRRATTRPEYGSRSRRNEERRSVFYSIDDEDGVLESRRHVDAAAINDDTDCLGSSRLYPDSYSDRSNEARVELASRDDRGGTSTSREPADRDETEANWNASGIDQTVDRSPAEGEKSSRSIEQVALEHEILENFDETIDRFDREKTNDEMTRLAVARDDKETERDSLEDSMQNGSCLSELTSPKVARLQETFNSSWDSGVGADVVGGSGWVRIHTGIESSLVYLTLDTTSRDVCRDMLLGDDLSLFIQVSGLELSRLIIHLIYDAKVARTLGLMRGADMLMRNEAVDVFAKTSEDVCTEFA
ncbi:hypothetical protein WN48_11290 [Eufriesea mexicana]|uniref:Uncharacterized protein n=1 Tax=Eufriesea mexicana TaxID=516756 RepID=A0A310SEZ0_9HYME|nr:hypothetical protein WN48_11290 [Eufriesea mexicana]